MLPLGRSRWGGLAGRAAALCKGLGTEVKQLSGMARAHHMVLLWVKVKCRRGMSREAVLVGIEKWTISSPQHPPQA